MAVFSEINSRMLGRNTWPPPSRAGVWAEAELFAAMLASDEVRLRQEASVGYQYPYVISPIPRLISRASANLLYGEPPEYAPAADADRDRLDFIVSENDLPAESHRGAVVTSSEGECFGRIVVQPALLDCPIIEYVSTRQVIPHFSGRFLVAATFVTVWQTGRNEFMRLFEHYEAGIIRNELWRGGRTSQGAKVDLDSFDPTIGYVDQVLTGFPYPLCVFIPNSIDADPQRGFSDYRGLEQRFLALNESTTIGQENMRLVGKKRALIDGAYLRDGKMQAGDDLLIRKSRDGTAGAAGKPLEVLEYDFDAEAVVKWIDHLLDTSLLFAGLSPQTVGRAVDGGAISGTALKLKQAHTLIESSGKGRFFDRGQRALLRMAAVIDSRRTTEGGFGRSWSEPDSLPSIERAPALPRDEFEAANRLVLLTNAGAISTIEKVRAAHPDWDDDAVQEEVKLIDAQAAALEDEVGGGAAPNLNLPPELAG